MKRYKELVTGEVWTEDEIRHEFEMFKTEVYGKDAPTFEEYLEDRIRLGRDGAAGLKEVRHYVVWMTDANGATSPIDTVDAPEGYTATDYYRDCNANAPYEWIAMLDAAVEITLEAVEE